MYEKVRQCPSCGGDKFINELICTDHTVSKESFALTKCEQCELLITNPRPDKDNIGKYYESDNYISHTNKSNNLTHLLYKQVRRITFAHKYKIINDLSKNKSILDFGCGTGDFLNYCQSHSWTIAGIEPNKQARDKAINQNGSNIYSDLSQLPTNSKFDIITLWHVLEHIPDPKSLINELKVYLNVKGKILIALPNIDSYDCNHFKESWAGYDVPRHLTHFNQKTFQHLIRNCKLKIIKIIPMKFDAFYISILSNKIKSGSSNYMKSFITGWKSNRWASNNDNNYSSLLYILKK